MICPDCNRSYPENGTVIRCICLKKNSKLSDTSRPYDPDWSCQLRGEELGILDCGCQGKPKVWACPLHGACAIRKLKPGITGYVDKDGSKVASEIQFCNRCQDRKPLNME